MCKVKKNAPGVIQSLTWFYDRVGKDIIRVNGNKKCKRQPCIEARSTGLRVHSRDFAEYLFEVQEYMHYRYDDIEVLEPELILI